MRREQSSSHTRLVGYIPIKADKAEKKSYSCQFFVVEVVKIY